MSNRTMNNEPSFTSLLKQTIKHAVDSAKENPLATAINVAAAIVIPLTVIDMVEWATEQEDLSQ